MAEHRSDHVGMSYEELVEMVDEFLGELAQLLDEEDEVDIETLLRFVAAMIYENNVRLRENLK
ncbi:MAG: hypothetical protein Q9O62_09580 [Ardenticatenia bacterium]|nr:hypothetical protein [Ardenticatenia bacterium]